MLSHLHNSKSEILTINRKFFKSEKRFERDCLICQKRAHLLQRFQFAPPSAQTFFQEGVNFSNCNCSKKLLDTKFAIVRHRSSSCQKIVTTAQIFELLLFVCATVAISKKMTTNRDSSKCDSSS